MVIVRQCWVALDLTDGKHYWCHRTHLSPQRQRVTDNLVTEVICSSENNPLDQRPLWTSPARDMRLASQGEDTLSASVSRLHTL